MALSYKNDSDQDNRLNPANDLERREHEAIAGYDRSKDGLDDHPVSGGAAGDNGNTKNIDDAKDREEAAGWKNNVTGGSPATKQKFSAKTLLKKKGPMGLIITLVLGGGLGFGALVGGPALIGIHAKEIMSDFFADRTSVLQARSDRIMSIKLQDSATKNCAIKVTCKYRGMSNNMIAKLEAKGVVFEKGTKVLTKTNIKKMSFPDGKGGLTEVKPAEFKKFMRENPSAAAVMSNAYKPKYMVWSDKVADKVRTKFNVTKIKNLSGNSDEEVKKSFQRVVVENQQPIGSSIVAADGETEEERAKREKASATNSDIQAKADAQRAAVLNGEPAPQTPSVSSVVEESTKSAIKSGAMGVLTPLAAVDAGCTAYNLVKAVGYGAKVVAAAQLLRYAHVIMNGWDATKAGDATATETEFLGNLMTATDAEGRSPTDSFGYKYVAYGDIGNPDNAYKYKVGGGMPATLTSLTSDLNRVLGGSPDEVCRFIKSGWGTATLVLAGIVGVAFGISSGGTTFAAQAAAGGAAGVLLGIAIGIATPILINIAAGTVVTGDEVGPDVLNAATAGMGVYNAQLSQAGGLAPLTKDEVVAYQNYNNTVIAAANKNEVVNQFDIYDKDSFAGQTATAMLPVTSQLTRPASFFAEIVSLPIKTFSSAITPAGAADSAAQFNVCTDEDYSDLNLAADPFCNLRYGVAPAVLEGAEFDPELVAQWMYDNGHIDEEGVEKSDDFRSFLADCVNRTDPIGSTGDESQGDNGAKCLQTNPDPAMNYFRMYYIDTTVMAGMDDEPLIGTAAEEAAPLQESPVIVASGEWTAPMAASSYSISSRFQEPGRPTHNGTDFAAPMNTPYFAVADGVVSSIETIQTGTLYVIIDHGGGVKTEYGHSYRDQIRVNVGDTVKAGQQIGSVGNQGNIITSRGTPTRANGFGAHLHFNYRKNGTTVNPETAMKEHGITL